MSPSRALIAVVAAVIARGDRYLVCRRPRGKPHAGLWEFPGGKVRAGESHSAALERELLEELGLRVTRTAESRFEHANEEAGVMVSFHDVEVDGEPEPLEHAELGWFAVEALRALSLTPSDAHFVRAVLRR